MRVIRRGLLLALVLLCLSATAAEAFPGGNGKLAFTRRDSAGQGIYTMNRDGSRLAALVAGAEQTAPSFSPAGTKVVFEDWTPLGDQVFAVNADGTGLVQLTDGPSTNASPVWSPDGTRISFASDRTGTWQVFVMNADGTGQTNISNTTQPESWPDWSSTGQIVFTVRSGSQSDLWTMASDGTGRQQITKTATDEQFPSWSPDGTQVAYTSWATGSPQIARIDAAGRNAATLTTAVDGSTEAAWSPDGTTIAFARNVGGVNTELFTISAGGTAATNLTGTTGVDEYLPDWQPVPGVAPAYAFNGFYSPVDNLPTLNSVNAGRAIPVKFGLGGDKGLDVFAAGYPRVEQVDCATGAPLNVVLETVAAGASSLTYDAGTARYQYVWKTDASWAGTCRQLALRFADATEARAGFKFK